METIVIYDSKHGNTEKLAEVIAYVFGDDTKLVKTSEFSPGMLEGKELLIIGSPTQVWNPSLSTIYLLLRMRAKYLKGIKAAAFDTGFRDERSGSAASKIDRRLRALGCQMIVPPERFYVADMEGPLEDGEVERAREWARRILELTSHKQQVA